MLKPFKTQNKPIDALPEKQNSNKTHSKTSKTPKNTKNPLKTISTTIKNKPSKKP